MSTLTGQSLRAALAGEAEVERVEHLRRAPELELLAVQHLPEQVRAAAGRVLLLACDHVARAHHAALRTAAVADPDAADRGVGEAAAVVRVGEVGLDGRRPVARARSGGSTRSGYGSTTLPGFILPSGSQIALNSRNASTSSSPNIFGSSSARDWPSPCSPESEPPSESTRSAASSRKRRQVAMPSALVEVEVPAGVDAALAVVAVERALVAVAVGQLLQLAQVLAEALGRDRRVLPALVRVGLAGDERGRAEARPRAPSRCAPRPAGRRRASCPCRPPPACSSAAMIARALLVGLLLRRRRRPRSRASRVRPGAARGRARCRPSIVMSSISCSSTPSSPSGRCSSTSGTWSAATAASS